MISEHCLHGSLPELVQGITNHPLFDTASAKSWQVIVNTLRRFLYQRVVDQLAGYKIDDIYLVSRYSYILHRKGLLTVRNLRQLGKKAESAPYYPQLVESVLKNMVRTGVAQESIEEVLEIAWEISGTFIVDFGTIFAPFNDHQLTLRVMVRLFREVLSNADVKTLTSWVLHWLRVDGADVYLIAKLLGSAIDSEIQYVAATALMTEGECIHTYALLEASGIDKVLEACDKLYEGEVVKECERRLARYIMNRRREA